MMGNNAAMLGFGLGMFPSLFQYLRAQNTDLQNYDNSGLSAGDLAAVSPDPDQAIRAYNAQNQAGNMKNNFWANLFGDNNANANTTDNSAQTPQPTSLTGAPNPGQNASNSQSGNLMQSLQGMQNVLNQTPKPITAAPAPMANYGSSGPHPLQNQLSLMMGRLPVTGAPAGPAGFNPMMYGLLAPRLLNSGIG